MNKAVPPVCVIAGPTASGKSALAVSLAQRTNGVIVNADSAQVYADLRILSARPDEAEMAGIEHRLFGHRDGASPCSAADWAEEARAVIADVHERGRLPILVGGTGLYLRTLLDGIAAVPPVDPAIRERVRAQDVASNHGELALLDAEAATRLHPNDSTRVARALEVILSTGRPLRAWQQETSGGIRNAVRLFGGIVEVDDEVLKERIDRRFAAMVAEGALTEVKMLLARGLSPTLPVMRAIGVPELAAHVEGRASLPDAIRAGQLATRQYAKRQRTWFRHQQLGVAPLPAEDGLGRLMEATKGK